MNEYYIQVVLDFGNVGIEDKNKKEAIQKVKDNFKEEYNIDLTDKEIKEVSKV